MSEQMQKWIDGAMPFVYSIGLKFIGALVLWLVGGWAIGWVEKMVVRGAEHRKVDTTLITYLRTSVRVFLRVVLVIAILGVFGVETTSFAAILAAGGVAIGAAWAGLLANFAAGVFLVVLRPVKVGDFISAGGTVGTVESLGLFVTTINTPDNVKTFVGNNKLFGDNIQNFSANAFRRVDRTAQLAHGADHHKAIALLREKLAAIPNVLKTPAPEVQILDFTPMGPVLAVRPHCHNDHYWDVYFATNLIIRDELGKAGFAVPEQHFVVASK
jgi:small conductance mechanosensitive channel